MRVSSLESRVDRQKRAVALRSLSGSSLPDRGMTLIELLFVIVILTTLVAAAVPLLPTATV